MDIHGYIHGYPRKVCGYGYEWQISYPRQAWQCNRAFDKLVQNSAHCSWNVCALQNRVSYWPLNNCTQCTQWPLPIYGTYTLPIKATLSLSKLSSLFPHHATLLTSSTFSPRGTLYRTESLWVFLPASNLSFLIYAPWFFLCALILSETLALYKLFTYLLNYLLTLGQFSSV